MTGAFIDRISDTRSHKGTDLQSLVKCLHHRQSDTVCSQARQAARCTDMHYRGVSEVIITIKCESNNAFS